MATARTSGPRHVAECRRIAGRFVASLPPGGDVPAGVTVASVGAFLDAMLADGFSRKSVGNAKAILSSFCSHLRVLGLMTGNPCRDVRCARADEVAAPVLDDTDVVALLASAGEHGLHAEVAVAVFAGLRLSEICRLRWADVDFARRVLLVAESMAGRPRTIPMLAEMADALMFQRGRTGHLAHIFPARKTWRAGWRYVDKPMSAGVLLRRLQPIRQAMPHAFGRLGGRRVGNAWHALRHTFATTLVGRDVNLAKVSAWLGHSDVRQTMRYTRIAKRYDSEIEKLRPLSAAGGGG